MSRFDARSLAQAVSVERNMAEYYLAMARLRGDEFRDGGDLKWIFTGSPVYNRVFGASFGPREAGHRAASALEKFKAAGLPVSWYVSATGGHEALCAALADNGLQNQRNWAAMSFDLSRTGPFNQSVPGLTVMRVPNERTLLRWIAVVTESFGIPAPVATHFRDYYLKMADPRSLPWDYFLGIYRGRPVACGKLFRGADSAGIYLIGTLPEFRRMGIADSMMRKLLSTAREEGYETAVLQASDMGLPLYRRLGFEEVMTIRIFAWTPRIA